LRFSVRDTGIGISPNDIPRLFSSFTQVDPSPTRRYGGSGLGLAICKRLCEAMHGSMWVESKGQGLGSSFHWTVDMRAPRLVISQTQRRKSVIVPVGEEGKVLAAHPQVAHWQKIAEKVGAAFMSTTGDVSVAGHERTSSMALSSGGKNSFALASASVRSLPPEDLEDLDKTMANGSRRQEAASGPKCGDKTNPLLAGKRILLLEPTQMIRHILMLALSSWGCHVCAVADEHEAIRHLVASRDSRGQRNCRGLTNSPDVISAFASPAQVKAEELMLRSTEHIDESQYLDSGPYDIILMDMSCTGLLKAITECDKEAQRIVFFGWPGATTFEKDENLERMLSSNMSTNMDSLADPPASSRDVKDTRGSVLAARASSSRLRGSVTSCEAGPSNAGS
jgi:CheY-like chemotaxis protein